MPPNWGTRTILLVEHGEGMIATYARILGLEGYSVHTALSGLAGLDDLASSQPDAVIVDFRMPDIDGLEFLPRIRADERYRHIPAAIVRGDHFLDERVPTQLHELGAIIRFKPPKDR